MTHHQDIVQGAGPALVAGWLISLWAWLTGGMAPLAVLLTVVTLALQLLKLWDAIQRKRRGKPLDTVRGDL